MAHLISIYVFVKPNSIFFQDFLTLKAPNTTIAEFANTADPDETTHYEPSHLDLQCLPSKVGFYNIKQFLLYVKSFFEILQT